MFHDTQYLFWSLALLFLNHPTQVKKPSDNVRFGCKIPMHVIIMQKRQTMMLKIL